MSSTATPYGFRPVGLLGSGTWSDATRQIKIASGYATAIFYGDAVKLVSAGTVEKDTGTTALTPVGIFVGCRYTDPTTNQPTYSQYWPASTAASDAFAYICDDPNIVFQAQGDASVAQPTLGNNVAVVQPGGSTAIGNSKNALDASTVATTNTLPVRILGFVDGPDQAVGDSFTDALCKWNAGHQYSNTTGV